MRAGAPDGRPWLFAAATFLVSWIVLVATSPGIPVVWDEGEYLYRSQQIIDWFRRWPLDFSREAIDAHWLFIKHSEGHPAGFAIPIAFTKWLGQSSIHTLTAARLGPIMLFSAACAAVAVTLRRHHGLAAAIIGPATLLTFPRIFSEAHFATQDGQLTAWWLMLWAIQTISSGRLGASVGQGVVLGLTTATKFTGWLAWAPAILSQLFKGRRAAYRLPLIAATALLIFFIVNPPLWHEPIAGMRQHFSRSLNRAETHNIPTLFLGHVYTIDRPLPWYNTLAWLVFVTPVPTLLLGLIGLWQSLRHPTVVSMSLLVHWLTLMVVRAIPGSPPHDGIRLFLPAFGFWCVFAGIGGQKTLDAIGSVHAVLLRGVMRAAFAGALLATAINLARYYPQTLSHYSLFVGGVRGASEKGMEAAYWWDALDNDVLRWLNLHATADDSVTFSMSGDMPLLHEWGMLVPKVGNAETEPFKWYVVQNRPGMFSRVDAVLMRREQPVYVKYAGRRPADVRVPPDLDVPLIAIFSYEQYQRARRPRS